MTVAAEPSALAELARHESALLADLAKARREAERIVAVARAEARRLQDEAERSLEQELDTLRKTAAAGRAKLRSEILGEAHARTEARREAAMARVPEAVQQVVAMIMPSTPRKEARS